MRRMTRQKKMLYDETKRISSFFDACELHANVLKKDPGIGLATVYRFLNLLENEGEIHSFMCDNKKIYSNNKKSHAHFRCEKCAEIKHIQVKNVDFLHKSTHDDICHFQIELIGVCSECKQ